MIITPHKNNHILVTVELGGGNFSKLSSFPGFTKWIDRSLSVRLNGANLQYIMNHWPEAQWIGGSSKHRDEYLEQQNVGALSSTVKAAPNIMPDDDFEYKREPMAHQRKAFLLSREREAYGLFMEQGTGKTKVTIDTACYLFKKGLIDMMVIIAWPNGVHRNWNEYELPEDMSVPYKASYWASNHRAKYRIKEYNELLEQPKDILKVFTFNAEAFVSKEATGWMERCLMKHRCLLVIDQSASIKNPQADRTKKIIKFGRLAKFRRILDGAPVAEGAAELYSQFQFLDPWIIGHDTWTGFKAEFCEIGYFDEIKGYKNMEVLKSKIDGYCFRVLADNCLDLPPRIYKKWAFDLGEEESRIYEDLKKENLAYFSGSTINPENPEEEMELPESLEIKMALIKNMRLQQISSGWWPGETFQSIEAQPTRLKALMELLKEVKGKSIIFARFRPDLELIQKTLGDAAWSVHGGIKDEQRDEAKRLFMNDPEVKYIIGQPQSLGIGHTLTAANNIIFYSNGHSLRMREECEKRAHRQGLKHKLFIWDLIATRTHDIKIINAFRMKKELANAIMEDPENFFLNYET